MTHNESYDEKSELPGLTEDNKNYLLGIAREAINNHVHGMPQGRLEYDSEVLRKNWGAFVTLKTSGELRGCIGNIVSDRPIPETIADMAVKSASSDPRFPPLGTAELDDLAVDISILGPLIEVKDISEIKIGVHGLVIEKEYRRGLLLPQVATENNMSVVEFLDHTCLKAGLPSDSWKHGARILKFAAVVF